MKKVYTLHDLPLEERPRERLIRLGEGVLSAQELLALLLGKGVSGEPVMVTAQKLLSHFGNLKKIGEASLEELYQIKGIGRAKAAQVKACFEIGERVQNQLEDKKRARAVENPEDLFKLLRSQLKDKAKEHFVIVCLDSRNRVIGDGLISIGTVNANLVHPREVFREAIRRGAVSLVLAHNHPSNDINPSEDDLVVTKKLVKAGQLLDIKVLDHVIVGENSYLSMKEKDLI